MTAVALALLAAQPAVASAEYVTDGGFEAGVPSPHWEDVGAEFGFSGCDVPSCQTSDGRVHPRSGGGWIWFGGSTNADVAHLQQQVTVPAGTPAVLSFWLHAARPRAGATLRVSLGGVERFAFVDEVTDGDPEQASHPYGTYTRIEIPVPASAFDGTAQPLRFDFSTPSSPAAVAYLIDDVSLVDGLTADVSLTLSPATDTLLLGEVATQAVTVANAGPEAADVSVRGALPAGLELVSAGGDDLACTPPAGPGDDLVCDAGTIPAGQSVDGQIVVRGIVPGSSTLTLDATVAAPAVDPAPANDSATATLQIEPVADLAATIDAPDDATVGVPFDVVLGARNDGPSPATDATLTSELPAGLAVDDAPADCAVSTTTVTCDLGALADGDDLQRTLTVVPSVAGDVELDVQVAATEHDPDTANDRATASVRVAAPPLPPGPITPDPPVTTPEPPTLPVPPAPVPPVTTPEPPVAPVCLSERRFTTRLLRGRGGPGLRVPAAPSRARIVSARLSGPQGWKARNATRTRSTVNVDLRGAPAGRYTLRVRVRIAAAGRSKARTVTVTRTYRTCQPGR